MTRVFALFVFLLPATAFAADKALILNDQEQAAFMQVLDAATKAEGLKIASTTIYLMNKLQQAPAVTEQKPPDPAKEPQK